MPDYSDLMHRFRRAYSRADAELLAEVLSADFEWHTHTFDADAPAPSGRVLRGIDGMIGEIERRASAWSDVSYEGLLERFAPRLVTQTFTISGNESGVPFHVAAVDLYDIDDDGRIAKKDTYWKQAAR